MMTLISEPLYNTLVHIFEIAVIPYKTDFIDKYTRLFRKINIKISIHAPREGGDTTVSTLIQAKTGFQSTPPARGATAKMHSFICESLINK